MILLILKLVCVVLRTGYGLNGLLLLHSPHYLWLRLVKPVLKMTWPSGQDLTPSDSTLIFIRICTADEISHSSPPSPMFSHVFSLFLQPTTQRDIKMNLHRKWHWHWQHWEGILIHATNSVNLYSSFGYKIPQLTVSVQWFTPPCGDWWRPHTTGFHSVSSVSTIEKLHSPR